MLYSKKMILVILSALFSLIIITYFDRPVDWPIIADFASDEFSQDKDSYTLFFVGDIMLDRGVKTIADRNQDNTLPFLKSYKSLKQADLLFGNLEGPISDKGRDVGGLYSFRFQPGMIDGLLLSDFDILSLANNHIFDWGIEALSDSVERLNKSGIATVGAGRNEVEAYKPHLVDLGENKLAFLAFADFYTSIHWAKGDRAGISGFEFDRVQEKIKKLKNEVDIIIVSFHFGQEYESQPNQRQVEISEFLIDSGADLIVGHHPHVIQPVEKYKDGLIAFSLGNFVFDQYFSKETMEGLLLAVSIKDGKIVDHNEIEYDINSSYQPVLDINPDGLFQVENR